MTVGRWAAYNDPVTTRKETTVTNERCIWTDCPYGGVITVGQRVSTDDQGVVLHLECRIAAWHKANDGGEEE